ncbi:MAG: 3-dehydroquinate synthase [Robiginitalea sp.]|uniref:3-dehydroquinate synthase n=1 Tax=Robiginitalea sp. TaxID=1902411 RepID=UPI003C77DF49
MDVLHSGSHKILFGSTAYPALNQLISESEFSKVFVLTDANTRTSCLPPFQKYIPQANRWEILEIPAGETFKTLHTCLSVWEQLSELGADRKSLLINLGGGVVTDLGGFVASAYQRGISFINIPTTLLAMVDASVGGKTGVDLGPLKNQIGLINNPEMVLIDPRYLETLDDRQITSGFAEMLKHGLILDKTYWKELSALETLDTLDTLIHRSVQLKEEVVRTDPKEKGLRKILNFGHTLGHAIESHFLTEESGQTLLHGEAIAAGMIMEAFISVSMCQMTQAECDEIKTVFLRFFPRVPITAEDQSSILSLLRYDKKNAHGHVLFALLEAIGKARTDQEVPPELLHASFDYYRE